MKRPPASFFFFLIGPTKSSGLPDPRHPTPPSLGILCLGDISFVRFALRLRPVGAVRGTLVASGQQQNDSSVLFEFLQKSGGKSFVALLRKMYAVIGQGNTPLSGVGKANIQLLHHSLT